METPRVILHIDLDYFFAQCEERENPSLKGCPLVVCVYSGRGEEGGVVSTANYVARGFGVKSGMPITFAKEALRGREAVFLPVNHELYERVSRDVMGLLRTYADSFEQVSIDEAFLDVTQRVKGDFEAATRLATQIKGDILAKERLTCSIGVGPNKLVAKLASEFQKPDGLTVVRLEEVKRFLYRLPVGKLYGVGKKTERTLNELGVKTVEDLAGYNVERLISLFGRKLGVYFHRAAQGLDDEPVQERQGVEQMSRIATLKEDTRDRAAILAEVLRLSEEVYQRTVEENLNFGSVGIMAVMEDMSTHTKSRTLEPPGEMAEALSATAERLLDVLLKEMGALKVRRIGVKVANLNEKGKQRALHEFLNLS